MDGLANTNYVLITEHFDVEWNHQNDWWFSRKWSDKTTNSQRANSGTTHSNFKKSIYLWSHKGDGAQELTFELICPGDLSIELARRAQVCYPQVVARAVQQQVGPWTRMRQWEIEIHS